MCSLFSRTLSGVVVVLVISVLSVAQGFSQTLEYTRYKPSSRLNLYCDIPLSDVTRDSIIVVKLSSKGAHISASLANYRRHLKSQSKRLKSILARAARSRAVRHLKVVTAESRALSLCRDYGKPTPPPRKPRPTFTPLPTLPTPTPTPVPLKCDYIINTGESINKYSALVRPGESVCIRGGIYRSSLAPQASGINGAYVTFRAYPGQECIQSSNQSLPPTCAVVLDGAGINLNGHSYIRIEGFEIKNFAGSAIWCQSRYSQNVHHIELVNNYIHDIAEYGIECRNALDVFIADNYIENIHGYAGIGIRGDLNEARVNIVGNTIKRVDCDGIHIEGEDIVIENNVLGDSYHTDCHQDAFEVYGPVDRLTIRNNKAWDWTQNIYLSAETSYLRNIEVLGNVIWCDKYCALGNNAPGVNAGPNVADITNLRIESNTFYNVWNLVTDGYARSTNYRITGLQIRNNIFSNSSLSVEVYNPFISNWNLFHQSRPYGHSSLQGYRGAGGTKEANSLELDPQFVDPSSYDLRLKSLSPARNRGVSIEGLTQDFEGTARPQGGAFEIGAFEVQE